MKIFEIKESELSPRLYESVKDFYARVIKAESEIIVLAKRVPVPPEVIPSIVPEDAATNTPFEKVPAVEANPAKKK